MVACIFVYNDSRCRRMRKERVGIKRNLHSALRFRDCRQTWTWSSVADNRTIHLHNERHSGGWADCRAAPPLRTGSVVPAAGGIRFRITHRLEYGSHIVASPDSITEQALAQIAGCTILGIGIALEVRCGSVTMPGEGFPVAVSCVTGIDFPKIKIVVDCSLVVLAVAFCYVFFGAWQWYIVGVGTLFAMLYVGIVVKIAGRHMAWFDKILNYRPGLRRYVYGLAKLIFRQKQ